MVYIYKTNTAEIFETNIIGRSYRNDWICLDESGVLIINDGYAWNGCSPKFHLTDILIGTPDGRINQKTLKPITWRASLLHDALYQFKKEVPISRIEADNLFYNELCKVSFFWRRTYYFFVRLFGKMYGRWGYE